MRQKLVGFFLCALLALPVSAQAPAKVEMTVDEASQVMMYVLSLQAALEQAANELQRLSEENEALRQAQACRGVRI